MNKSEIVDYLRSLKVSNPQRFKVLEDRAKAELTAEAQRLTDIEEIRRKEREVRASVVSRYRTALTVVGVPNIDLSTVEGMVAFRQWKYDGKYLRSTAYSQHAWGSQMIADRVPIPSNAHGLYCVKLDSWGLTTQVETYVGAVCGLIELRGDVLEHEDGVLRAEWARVLCIFVTVSSLDTYTIVPALRSVYPTVPVHVLSPRQLVETLFRIAVWQEMRGDMWPEKVEKASNYTLPTKGVILRATWEESEVSERPYVRLEIDVEPFVFGGREKVKLYSHLSAYVPTSLGGISPLEACCLGIGVSVGPPMNEGTLISELTGRGVQLRVEEVEYQGEMRLRTKIVG